MFFGPGLLANQQKNNRYDGYGSQQNLKPHMGNINPQKLQNFIKKVRMDKRKQSQKMLKTVFYKNSSGQNSRNATIQAYSESLHPNAETSLSRNKKHSTASQGADSRRKFNSSGTASHAGGSKGSQGFMPYGGSVTASGKKRSEMGLIPPMRAIMQISAPQAIAATTNQKLQSSLNLLRDSQDSFRKPAVIQYSKLSNGSFNQESSHGGGGQYVINEYGQVHRKFVSTVK